MINPLGAAYYWAAEYWAVSVAGILEAQQNGLQVTTQVERQLEVQVPKTAGGTPAKQSMN